MKKIRSILMIAVLVFSFAACAKTQQKKETSSETKTKIDTKETIQSKDETDKKTTTNGKTLIAYFSWSSEGNTEKMATYIQKQTGGDLLKLEPAKSYPTDYNKTGDIAKEERDKDARPKIKDLPKSISEYDTIFVGYPIWWHTAPMIIGTFLENYDLSNVQIYPFTQSSSMDTEQFDNSMKFVKKNAKGANVHDGLFVEATDTEGEIGWESATFVKAGRPDSHVIEILTESTSDAYKAYLREKGVSYIIAGENELDCKVAAQKLNQYFEIDTLLICGGGRINWSFLQQGVVDELSLILAPAADGSSKTPTVFEESEFAKSNAPVEFQLKNVEQLNNSGVRLTYLVKH